ncbi:MAG TPA: translation initiation factor IF-3 [Verrucomicrobiae bacterium]|nr:translation initiation factor IF-3 [Verrucomicrobiae bacterium]
MQSGTVIADLSANLFRISTAPLPVNHAIRASRVYLIDETGTPVGDTDVPSALKRAEELNLDLVLVAPQANPPVAKILDYGKFKYEEDRKERKNRAKKSQEIKEIRLSYNTGPGDLETKLRQAKRFLEEGHRIKLRLKLVGREMAFKEKGIEELGKFRDLLDMEYEQIPARQGKQFTVLLKEKKKEKNSDEA